MSALYFFCEVTNLDTRKKTDMKNVMIFVGAIIIATFAVNFMLRQNKDFGYLNLSVYDYVGKNVLSVPVAVFIFFRRLKQFVIIYAVMKLLKNETLLYAIIAFLGAMYGVLSCVQVYYDGLNGVILLLLYVMPHYILYIFLIIKTSEFIRYGSGEHRYARFFTFALVILIVGVGLESIISRFFLTNFYQYMGRL